MCARWCWRVFGLAILSGSALLVGCQSREPERDVTLAEPPVVSSPPEPTVPEQESSPARETRPAGKIVVPSGWGHLRGRFLFDGTPPAPRALAITSDVEYCSMHRPQDESLVVHPDNAGLANVVVTLFRNQTDAPPPIHPSFTATASAKVQLDNQKCRFRPHVVVLRTSQTLEILNSDEVAHNTKIDTLKNPPINLTLPASGSLEQRFAVEERAPAQVSCNIHPWMVAWIVVREDPYFAVADANGEFTIQNLPAGKWTFQAWHEQTRFVARVRQNGQSTAWNRGRFVVEIQPDQTTDLGEIRVERSLFGER